MCMHWDGAWLRARILWHATCISRVHEGQRSETTDVYARMPHAGPERHPALLNLTAAACIQVRGSMHHAELSHSLHEALAMAAAA